MSSPAAERARITDRGDEEEETTLFGLVELYESE